MMSKKRHGSAEPPPRSYAQPRPDIEDGILVRSYAVRHLVPHVIPPHAHDWHQLIYASEGVMWVHTAQGDWVVPPNRAVWVPAGIEHSIEMAGAVLVQTVYLSVQAADVVPAVCCAVNVSPLLRELIVHTVALGMLHRDAAAEERLLGFLIDQLSTLPTIPLQLPLPIDERAKCAAAWIREHPGVPCSTRQLARKVAVSVRTLERLYKKDTGMTVGKWCQQLRLLQALRRLAAGRPVTSVALEVGYSSPSAFIAMFKRILGTTPYRYFATTRSALRP